MDQSTDNLAAPRGDEPQEVVLHYEARVTPIVERYVQPTPLPASRRRAAPAAPRRRRRGLRIFLLCMLALVLTGGGVTAWWFLSDDGGDYYIDNNFGSYWDGRFEYRGEDGYYSDAARGKTTIPRAPHTKDVRLTYNKSGDTPLSVQEVYQKVNPSTVTVLTGMEDGSAMVGTGVIITGDGYILTNAHVIAGGSECYAILDTGDSFPARLLGLDEDKDLAVIKVDVTGLPAAEFGDSDALTVGDPVYAIGNPLGVELRGTLTDGIVSAINRTMDVDGVTMTLIQTNAALNNGNSGGPLINQYGQVVGINTMKMGSSSTKSVEGLGFAIPISSAAYMVNDLIAYGTIGEEAVLGITVLVAPVTLDSGGTALSVLEVTPDGPGDEAGIRADDLLITADGEALASSHDLIRIRRRHHLGETLTLVVERGGTRFTAEVVLRALDE